MLEVLIIIPIFFMNSVLPTLSRHIKDSLHGKVNKIKDILVHSYHFLITISFASCFGAIILAKPIVLLMSNNEFLSNFSNKIYGSDLALQILMIAMVLTFLTTFLNFVLIAYGKQKKLLWINLKAVIFNLVTNLIFIPKYGLVGAAITSSISEGLILVLGFIELKRTTKDFKPGMKNTIKILFSALVMGLFTYFAYHFLANLINPNIALLMVIILSVALFLIMLFVVGAINGEMLKLIRNKKDN